MLCKYSSVCCYIWYVIYVGESRDMEFDYGIGVCFVLISVLFDFHVDLNRIPWEME